MNSTSKLRDQFSNKIRKRTIKKLLIEKRRKFIGNAPSNNFNSTSFDKILDEFRNLCFNMKQAYNDKNASKIIESMKQIINFLSDDKQIILDFLIIFEEASGFYVINNILSEIHKNNFDFTRLGTWILINLSSVKVDEIEIFIKHRIVDKLVEMLDYCLDIDTIQNIFWALTNLVERNADVRDVMQQNEFTSRLIGLLQKDKEFNYDLPEEFFEHLVELINKFTSVRPSLKFEVYRNFAICCNNVLSSANFNNNESTIIINSLKVLRDLTNIANGIEDYYFFSDNCLNFQKNLVNITKNKYSDTALSYCYDIFGNLLNLAESDENENKKTLNFILEHLYEDMFNAIESPEHHLSESGAFLLSNVCILNHEMSEQLVRKQNFLSKMIESIILSTNTITTIYMLRAYLNILGSIEFNVFVELMYAEEEVFTFIFSKLDDNCSDDIIIKLLDILEFCLKVFECEKERSGNEINYITDIIVQNSLYVEKLEKLQMNNFNKISERAEKIIDEYFDTKDIEINDMNQEF